MPASSGRSFWSMLMEIRVPQRRGVQSCNRNPARASASLAHAAAGGHAEAASGRVLACGIAQRSRGRLRVSSGAYRLRCRLRMIVAATFEIEYLQYLGQDGRPVQALPKGLDAKTLLPLFKQMLFVRTFDSKAIALQRTGKLG